jgi:hypothetical protein
MNLNGFSVSVPQALEEKSDGYVVLNHAQPFSIRLHNHHRDNGNSKPADAEIWIQGKLMGIWRVPANQTIVIERSTEDDGKFTAYRNGSTEAKQIGLDATSDENGLIKVVWKPGYKPERPHTHIITSPTIIWPYVPYCPPEPWTTEPYLDWDTGYKITYGDNTTCNAISATRSCSYTSSNDLCGGGVGLSGHSSQNFSETEALSYDETSTTIYLRIAFRDNEPRPLKSVVYKVETNIPRRLK